MMEKEHKMSDKEALHVERPTWVRCAEIAQSYYEPQLQAKDKEIAAKDAEIEKLKGLLEEFVTGNHADEEAEYLWQAYCKEKGIE